ncbi:Tat pathway signal protein [Rhizobium sp. BK251]|uniref:alpha-amylase family protein n=1 Tax=Rhizobium sp. BK251 TaxID=2512125 RepID=UPI00104FB5C0|nr:Tat pathway signal protein [Rhizobium sp. BK251]TCL63700.1 beta-galactosidase GanA [Rhizobium sp. BK251]
MGSEPWYRTARRWGQTNLVEIDPARYDGDWWREHWRRTRINGVIVNAGGIVSYYPTKFPLHHRAETLGDRDLYGEVVAAAREEGLKLIARMDSNRVADDFYRAHPDWICLDIEGKPYRQADKYITCINSPYYSEYLPSIMEEIIERSRPDGFADNSWAGIPRKNICYCRHCSEQFFAWSGVDLPRRHDWDDENYRLWIGWNFQRRTELWELNNRVTTKAGGENCHWMGMISGDVLNNCNRFIDLKAILSRSPLVMLDHQRRNGIDGFEDNTEAGKRLHEVGGWDKLIPESTPQYQLGSPAFRLASMPVAEVRLWSSAAFAGGIQPWWHHIGSSHEDRRQYRTAEPIFTWHEANEDILFNRRPESDVGVVWSQTNHDFHGRDRANDRTMNPYRGMLRSLDRAGITHLPVHADDIAGAAGRFHVLILPNLAAMSDEQVEGVRVFAAQGGSVIASSETSLYSQYGDKRPDFALADLFGLHHKGASHGGQDAANTDIETSARHTYLRLLPELRAGVHGPKDATAPKAAGERHPVLAGFEDTDTLPFGGFLPVVGTESDVTVLATFIPDFPIYPPETSWMRKPHTHLPAITVREGAIGSRFVWFVADLDRCFARDEQFEHGRLIANAVNWILAEGALLTLEGGHGFITAAAYRQGNRQIVHLNNRVLTSRIPGRQAELLPIGPVTLRLRRKGASGAVPDVSLRVSSSQPNIKVEGEEIIIEIGQIFDHEVIVVD